MRKLKSILKLGIGAVTLALAMTATAAFAEDMVDYCLDDSGNIRQGVDITGHFSIGGVPYVIEKNQTPSSVNPDFDKGLFGGSTPSTILDGKRPGFYGGFAWGWGNIDHGSYIQIDLGATRDVNQIIFECVNHGDAYWRKARILVSNDENFETYTEICGYTQFEIGVPGVFDYPKDKTKSFRYLRILTFRLEDTIAAAKKVTIKGYCDDLFEGWNVPEIMGSGSYDVSIPVTHYKEPKQYTMQIAAYDADNKLTAFSSARVEAQGGSLTSSISVPDGTTSLRASLINDIGEVVYVVDSSESDAQTFTNETVTLSGSDFADFTADGNTINVNALGNSDDFITLYVIKDVDKSKPVEDYFDELGENIGDKMYFASVGKSKDGIKFSVPFDTTGLYYFRVVKSGKDGTENLYYRFSMVTDEKKQEFVDKVFQTEGDDYDSIISEYVDDLELLTDSNTISIEQIKEDGFVDTLIKVREMMFKDKEQNLDNAKALFNASIIVNRFFDGDYEAAEKDISKSPELLSFIGEYSSFERFAAVAKNVVKSAMTSTELEKALKHSAMLSYIQGGTAQEIADELEKNGVELGVDISDCKDAGVELTRVAARLDNTNAASYYGDGLKNAFAAAIAAEKKQNDDTDNKKKPTSSSGGGGGGGGLYSPVTKPTATTPTTPTTPTAPTEPTDTEKVSFSDLAGYDWAKDSISKLVDAGVLNGYSDGSFNPSGNVSRVEFVKMLVKGLGITVNEKKEMRFTDCVGTDWFYPYVAVAYSVGCVNGVDEFNFGTTGHVTRQDLAVMIFNAMQYKGVGLAMTEEKCSEEIADYASEAFNVLIEKGIITGYSDGTYKPTGEVTRAEAAVILCRVIDYIDGGAI